MPLPRPRSFVPVALRLLGMLLLFATLAVSPAAFASDDSPSVDTDQQLGQLRARVDEGQKALQNGAKLGDSELQALRARALEAQARALDMADKLGPDLGAIDAQIAQLGTLAPGSVEAPDVASRRAQLKKARAVLDGEIRLARLIAVEAEQLAVQLWTLRRSQFQARLGERTHSILARPFWAELLDDLPRDRQRLAALGGQLAAGAVSRPPWAWLPMPIVLAALLGAGWWFRRRVLGWLVARSPDGRLRRSLHALVVMTAWTLGFGVAALALSAGFDGGDALPAATGALLERFSGMLWFGGYVYGLSTALLSVQKPSWRLPNLPDAVARSLRWFPAVITTVMLLLWLAERLVVLVNASLAATVAVNCVGALAMSLTLTLSLMHAERIWRRELAKDGSPARPILSTIVAAVNWLVLIVAVASLLTGYVAFGSFAVKQVVWSGVVVGSIYVSTAFVDDLLMAWLAPGFAVRSASTGENSEPTAGRAPHLPHLPHLPPRTARQIGVLASGILRLALLLLGAMLVLMPFGEGPGELLRQTGSWHPSLVVGQFTLEPIAVLQALLVLLGGLGVVRLLRRWLSDRYLPATSLDPSMRSSATALFGYAGVIVAIALAMSALGIGLERITWVASALSVGIGFGLQAVVQNFVSGLILLAERPVKAGDWVSLGGIEGDIRRINVRATEIEMSDKSTVIVPNSEFITKVVRNVTLANPIGLVSLKLPVPIGSDAAQVRDLLLAAFDANEQVLDAPAPTVLLDGVDNGALVFNATAFVDSPRNAYGVRSAVLFDILQRLQAAGVALAKPPTMVLRDPGPGAAASSAGADTPVALPGQ